MYENKMKENDNSVIEFIESVENGKKKADAYRLLEIFEETTGCKAKMWGSSIIGFGKYHYKYASGHEGEAPLAGFSPRKGKFACIWPMRARKGKKCCRTSASTRRARHASISTSWTISISTC